jgi:hypothetical protein
MNFVRKMVVGFCTDLSCKFNVEPNQPTIIPALHEGEIKLHKIGHKRPIVQKMALDIKYIAYRDAKVLFEICTDIVNM